jgi:hypothetical protein
MTLDFTDTMIYDSFVEGYSFDAHFWMGFGAWKGCTM